MVQVLDLLASRPADRLTNQQIASTLELDSSTSLGILNELAQCDYVVRHTDRTYGLGPRLVVVGRAARASRPSIAFAQPALQTLVGELDVACTVSALAGGEIVVLEAEAPGSGAPAMLAPGARFPFVAPVGVMFAAWQGDDAVEAWLGRAPVGLDDHTVERVRAVISGCRRTGVLVQRLTDEEANLHRLLPLFFDDYQRDQVSVQLTRSLSVYGSRDYLVNELDDDGPLSVSFICAPSFDRDGALELVVGAYLLRADADRDEVARAMACVRQAAAAITAGVGGRDPWT